MRADSRGEGRPLWEFVERSLRGGTPEAVFEAGEVQLRSVLPPVAMVTSLAGAVGASAQFLLHPQNFRPWALAGYVVLALAGFAWRRTPPRAAHAAATVVALFLATMIGELALRSGSPANLLHLAVLSIAVFYFHVGRGSLVIVQGYMFAWLLAAASFLLADPTLDSHLIIAVVAWCGGLALHVGRVRVLTEQVEMRQALDEESEARRRVQDLLLEARKRESLGLMAGGVAHDFNNLLVGIVGGLDLLTTAKDEAGRSFAIDMIRQSSVAAQELSRQMLDLAGGRPVSLKFVALRPVLEEALSRARLNAPNDVRVEASLPEGLPGVEADRTQLLQVVSNLLTNAIEATAGEGGTVRLDARVDAEGEAVLLGVSDEGPGVSTEIRDRIFDPFFTTKFTGRGLGLATVASIVETHGGSIELLDPEAGLGARFAVRLPVAKAPAQAPASQVREPHAWTGAGIVLLVDDEEAVRRTGRKLLEGLGFEVDEASGGREAIDLLASRPDRIRAAIVDATMPGLGGAETVEALRKIQPDLPILLSSGYAKEPGSESDRVQGEIPFLAKPYGRDGLRGALAELLSKD